MKKRILSFLLSLLLVVLSACAAPARQVTAEWPDFAGTQAAPGLPGQAAQQNPSGGPATDTWAIYWYLCGSDLESQGGYATIDLQEMMEVALPDNVTIVIQTGGAEQWNNDAVSADVLGRYLYRGDELTRVEERPSASMGSADTLADFLRFCNRDYPADRQVVVFWNHGGGSLTGVAFDEVYDGDSLTLPELRAAFEAVPAASGLYEMVGFDACLMATVDVADVLMDHARYMLASEEVEAALGWDYTGFLSAFAQGGPANGEALGKEICDTFYAACEAAGCAELATLSVVDLGKVAPLLDAYRRMGEEVLLYGCLSQQSYLGAFGRAARAAENYGGNNDQQGYTYMVDLGDLIGQMEAEMTGLMMPASGADILAALKECVVYQVKGPLRAQASGLACYYNYSGGTASISRFQELGTSDAFATYFAYATMGYMSARETAYVEALAAAAGYDGFTPNQNLFENWTDLNGIAIQSGEDSDWVVPLTQAQAESLSDVRLEIFREVTDGYVSHGYGLAVNFSWDGELRSWFPQGWGALDGTLVYMTPAGRAEGYALYAAPVLLNGEQCALIIGETGGEYTLLGAQRILENGMADKELYQLAPGDVVEPILPATTDVDGGDTRQMRGGEIVVNGDTRFVKQDFPAGSYRVRFVMTDFAGNRYVSQSAPHTVG